MPHLSPTLWLLSLITIFLALTLIICSFTMSTLTNVSQSMAPTPRVSSPNNSHINYMG